MKKMFLLLLCLTMLLMGVPAAQADELLPFYEAWACELTDGLWIEVPGPCDVFDGGTSFASWYITDGTQFCMITHLPEGYKQSYTQVMRGDPDVSGFQAEGEKLLAGAEDTGVSRVIERYTIDDLPAVRVEMLGQGFEMIWVGDAGDMYFFMYPTEDEAFAAICRDAAATLHFAVAETEPRCDAADYTYTVEADGVTITAYTGTSRRVKVPDVIEDKPVLRIAERAFYETGVTWVSLPDTVTDIGTAAFSGCNDLQTLHLPAQLKAISPAMLESCFRLHGLDIPEGVERIDTGALWCNFYLERLSLPASLTVIEHFNFTQCLSLERFDLAAGSTAFRTLDDGRVLLSADGTQFISYRPWQERTEYVIPDGVTTIWPYAFADMGTLKRVTAPESVTTVYGTAFHGTMWLEELHLSANATDLGRVSGEEGFVSVCSQAATIYAPEGSDAHAHAQQFKQSFMAENPAVENTNLPNNE